MRRLRFSIAGIMGAVAVAAVGLAAWRNADETWAGVMLLLTLGILALAIVGAIYRDGAGRAWWLGFSVFGWGYVALWTCCDDPAWPTRPTTLALRLVEPWIWSLSRPAMGGMMGGLMGGTSDDRWFLVVGQCLWALLAASIGGVSAWFFFATSAGRDDRVRAGPPEEGDTARDRRLVPTLAGLVVLILGCAIATIRSGVHAPPWAGITLSLTCVFIGLAILGAVLGRGHRRRCWLGAALFGGVYIVLVFGRPVAQPSRASIAATDQLLKAMRPWFPAVPRSTDAAHARILDALEKPIPMRFPNEMPLEDLLKYIKRETATPAGSWLPIYVDPIGLQEAERTMQSTVQIDVEGVPLRTTLALCLKQLGLAYEVKDGVLRITYEQNVSSSLEDPFLIVGHCLLALIAAGIGAVAAPIAAGSRAGTDGPESSDKA